MKLRIDDSIIDILIKMSNGMTNVSDILTGIIEQGGHIDPYVISSFSYIFELDNIGIYDNDIYKFYEICNKNISYMIVVLKSKQLGYIDKEEIKENLKNNKPFDISDILLKIKGDFPDFLV
jgi:hypothetical protein